MLIKMFFITIGIILTGALACLLIATVIEGLIELLVKLLELVADLCGC